MANTIEKKGMKSLGMYRVTPASSGETRIIELFESSIKHIRACFIHPKYDMPTQLPGDWKIEKVGA